MFMLILAKKQIKKKFEFFDQNPGLALLENWDFWPYERFPVLWSKKVLKKVSFLFLNIKKLYVYAYFSEKTNKEKI